MRNRQFIALLLGLIASLTVVGSAWARSIYVSNPNGYVRNDRYRGNPYYYGDQYYQPNVVIIERSPVIIPRYGSNDSLYTYDNIYGPEASAAGRLSHSVHNPQPFYNIYNVR